MATSTHPKSWETICTPFLSRRKANRYPTKKVRTQMVAKVT